MTSRLGWKNWNYILFVADMVFYMEKKPKKIHWCGGKEK